MNLFKKAKLKEKYLSNIKFCLYCKKEFEPDLRNVNRGSGIFCSKKCSQSHLNYLRSLEKSERISELRNKKLAQLGI